jgi:division protein CdvB (Snf7/Vps24/ESCRT-III family)
MGLLVKTTKLIQGFLSDLKYGIKNHTQRLAYLSENLGKRLSIDEMTLSMRTLYYFDQQSSKGKKGTIV